MNDAVRAFLLAFPALFSIVNPISGAFIFREITLARTRAEHARLARAVAINAFAVMMVALWGGSYLLAFFGITLPALRVAGGLVVASAAWGLLHAPERREAQKQQQAAPAEGADDIAFFPLTVPFTTGPGTMAVAVALGAGHPRFFHGLGWFFLGESAATAAIAAVIWVSYRYAESVVELLGPTGSRVISRLMAFILLCIGVQIMIAGIGDVLIPLLPSR